MQKYLSANRLSTFVPPPAILALAERLAGETRVPVVVGRHTDGYWTTRSPWSADLRDEVIAVVEVSA